MKIALIGFGYWGEKMFKILLGLKKTIDYFCVVDVDPKKKKEVGKYKIDYFSNLNQVRDKVDACIITTWEDTHYEIAKKCLLAGKHVLVEKPLALNYIQARELIELADKKNLILMANNIFMYDKSFSLIKNTIIKGQIGRLKMIDSYRFSPNIIKPFTNVIVDLLPHDISIFCSLLKGSIGGIEVKVDRIVNQQFDNAQVMMKFGQVQMHSFLSWTHPIGKREMVFYGSKGALLWQKKDGETDEIIQFRCDKAKRLKLTKKFQITHKNQTIAIMLNEFFQSIIQQKEAKTSGRQVLAQVKILEQVLTKV